MLDHETPPVEILIASLLFMLTRYNNKPCERLQHAIVEHFGMVLEHPNLNNSGLSNTCRRLKTHWEQSHLDSDVESNFFIRSETHFRNLH
jgi:hypothetical protein